MSDEPHDLSRIKLANARDRFAAQFRKVAVRRLQYGEAAELLQSLVSPARGVGQPESHGLAKKRSIRLSHGSVPRDDRLAAGRISLAQGTPNLRVRPDRN